jgi:hypothetical protein
MHVDHPDGGNDHGQQARSKNRKDTVPEKQDHRRRVALIRSHNDPNLCPKYACPDSRATRHFDLG